MKKRQQVLRTKEIPNKQLGDLIDRVNLLPANEKLKVFQVEEDRIPNFQENQLLRREPKYAKYALDNWKTHQMRLELERVLHGKPPEFRKYIWGKAKPQINLLKKICDPEFDMSNLHSETKKAVKRYEDFRELNEQIRGLAGELKYWHQKRKDRKIKVDKEENFIPFEFLTVGFGVVYYEIDEADILQFKFDELSTALKGVEAGRIRECEFCKRMFWAGRIDKVCCSKKCINNYNQRRFRNLSPEEKAQRNEQRKANRKKRKEVEALKEERKFRESLK